MDQLQHLIIGMKEDSLVAQLIFESLGHLQSGQLVPQPYKGCTVCYLHASMCCIAYPAEFLHI